MQDFPRFSHFPAEIRIRIWELVPVPARLLALNHCNCTRTHTKLGATRICKQQGHLRARSAFRWSVYPRDAAIPPALHCCRESRHALLRRYVQPPCETGVFSHYVTRRGDDGEAFPVAFQCPFVDYANDIFVIRPLAMMRSVATGPLSAHANVMADPLPGLDVSRIQHVGWLDNFPRFSSHPSRFTPLNDLVALRDLTILDMGEEPSPEALERLAEQDFSLQARDSRPKSPTAAHSSFLWGENMAISTRRIQVVLWHARHGVEIALWHQLRKQLTDPEIEARDEFRCYCSLGRPHTVPLDGEIASLRWMHVCKSAKKRALEPSSRSWCGRSVEREG